MNAYINVGCKIRARDRFVLLMEMYVVKARDDFHKVFIVILCLCQSRF